VNQAVRGSTYPFASGSKVASSTGKKEESLRSMGALSKTADVITAIGHERDAIARRCGSLFVFVQSDWLVSNDNLTCRTRQLSQRCARETDVLGVRVEHGLVIFKCGAKGVGTV